MISLLCDGPLNINAGRLAEFLTVADRRGIWQVSNTVPEGEADPAPNVTILSCETDSTLTISVIATQATLESELISEAISKSWWIDKTTNCQHDTQIWLHALGSTDFFEQVRSAKLLSLIAGILSENSENVRAVWNGYTGTLYNRSQMSDFFKIAATEELPPLMFWIYTAYHSVIDGDVSSTTGGLDKFIGHEIEIWNAPLQATQVNDRLSGIIRYLLLKGPVILDGQTIGGEDDDFVITCKFLPSRVERSGDIKCLHLTFLTPEQPNTPALSSTPASKKQGFKLSSLFGFKR